MVRCGECALSMVLQHLAGATDASSARSLLPRVDGSLFVPKCRLVNCGTQACNGRDIFLIASRRICFAICIVLDGQITDNEWVRCHIELTYNMAIIHDLADEIGTLPISLKVALC